MWNQAVRNRLAEPGGKKGTYVEPGSKKQTYVEPGSEKQICGTRQ